MLNKTKTLTTTAGLKEAKEKALKSTSQTGKEPYEMQNGAKPLSDNNSWAEEGQRKSPKMNQSNWKGAL